MDLEVDIVNAHLPDEEQMLQETQQIAIEITTHKEYFPEEESFTIKNALFEFFLLKLVFEGINQINKKGKYHSKYEFSNFRGSQISKLHKVIGNALYVSIDDLEPHNFK
jgi:hypothetical protein